MGQVLLRVKENYFSYCSNIFGVHIHTGKFKHIQIYMGLQVTLLCPIVA